MAAAKVEVTNKCGVEILQLVLRLFLCRQSCLVVGRFVGRFVGDGVGGAVRGVDIISAADAQRVD